MWPLDSESPRSPEARALAERVLLSLVHALGERSSIITVLGGLVPEVLTRGQEPPVPRHLGTTDVDVMLAVHVAGANHGYESLEHCLERLGFEPDRQVDGWRWRAMVDGHLVRIEFLCDLDDVPNERVVRPEGCEVLGAANLRGTRYAAEDAFEEVIDGALVDQPGTVRLRVRFAGIAGYLMAKAYAITGRGAAKDYYDFAYVVIYNSAGGPTQAGTAIIERFPRAGSLKRLWAEIEDRFGSPERVGPSNDSEQHRLVAPEDDPARLRNDAFVAVGEFMSVIKAASGAVEGTPS